MIIVVVDIGLLSPHVGLQHDPCCHGDSAQHWNGYFVRPLFYLRMASTVSRPVTQVQIYWSVCKESAARGRPATGGATASWAEGTGDEVLPLSGLAQIDVEHWEIAYRFKRASVTFKLKRSGVIPLLRTMWPAADITAGCQERTPQPFSSTNHTLQQICILRLIDEPFVSSIHVDHYIIYFLSVESLKCNPRHLGAPPAQVLLRIVSFVHSCGPVWLRMNDALPTLPSVQNTKPT